MGGVMDGLENFGRSVTGYVAKAALLVRRINPANSGLGAESGSLASLANPDSAIGIADVMSNAESVAGAAVNSIAGGGRLTGNNLINFVKQHRDWDYFEFQYNPEIIYINSQAGSYMSRQGAPEQGLNQVTMTDIPAQTSMNFKVYFYDINNASAFLQDKLIVSASAVAKDIEAIAATYSVQTPVEGLVSLVTQYATRQAVFVMGEVVFFGEIETVNAQYTMFSPTGHPIAAVVDISIRQSSAGIKDEDGYEVHSMSHTYWDDAFERLFGKPGVDQEVHAKTTADKFGGAFLNLNM
ncbi:MAG: hypothetical protein K5655_03870 [Lachnospiraceae bacterium]|nr:hypothetical protein [Lachnospiraceae bacterium]